MSVEEELGKIVGTSDQSVAAFVTIAACWARFFTELVANGMTREEATKVTAASAAAQFGASSK